MRKSLREPLQGPSEVQVEEQCCTDNQYGACHEGHKQLRLPRYETQRVAQALQQVLQAALRPVHNTYNGTEMQSLGTVYTIVIPA